MAKDSEKAEKPKREPASEGVVLQKLVEDLIESNISLQHKMADLILDTKDLNKGVKDMVRLFTEAGEHIKKGKYEDPLLVKLDELLEQNKNVAKGLLLLEKFVREKSTATPFMQKPFGQN